MLKRPHRPGAVQEHQGCTAGICLNKHAEDLAPLFALTMSAPQLTMPMETGTNPSRIEEMIYTENVKQFLKWESTFEGNLATTVQQDDEGPHKVLWPVPEQDQYKRFPLAPGIDQSKNPKTRWNENIVISLLDAWCNLLNWKQTQGQTMNDFKETLKVSRCDLLPWWLNCQVDWVSSNS